MISSRSWKDTQDASFLAQLAVTAATSLSWEEAVKINRKILTVDKNDVEALNRLARAYCCLGKIKEAKKAYAKVLKIDPYNIIAKKNFERLSSSTENSNKSASTVVNINLSKAFVFEPGRTKIVALLNLAPPTVLSILSCGDQVRINAKSHSITITTSDNVYLGALPDDLAYRLNTFIKGGNKYEVYVKSATSKLLTVFIREIYKSPKFASQPTFQYKSVFSDNEEYSIV